MNVGHISSPQYFNVVYFVQQLKNKSTPSDTVYNIYYVRLSLKAKLQRWYRNCKLHHLYIIVPASNFEHWIQTIVLQSSESVEWRAQNHFTSRLWLTAESNFMLCKLIDVKSAILLEEKDITQNNGLLHLKCWGASQIYIFFIILLIFKMLIIRKIS